MPSAHAPNPVDTSGTGLERNGPGAPGAAESAATHAASWSGCQSTVMAPPLAEWAVPFLPSTPSCSPVSRLSSAPKYTLAPWASAAAEPSGEPDCGVTVTVGGAAGGFGGAGEQPPPPRSRSKGRRRMSNKPQLPGGNG